MLTFNSNEMKPLCVKITQKRNLICFLVLLYEFVSMVLDFIGPALKYRVRLCYNGVF